MNYFAYGSNLSTKRLKSRLPSALVVGLANLSAHKLIFHKKSKDGSAKCNAFSTSNCNDGVIGVVYDITEEEKSALDKIEERGHGYDEKHVLIQTVQGDVIEAVTYVAIEVDASLKPYHWYKEHVLIGAREHHFPTEYIQDIEQIESIEDPIRDRQARELQIYSVDAGSKKLSNF